MAREIYLENTTSPIYEVITPLGFHLFLMDTEGKDDKAWTTDDATAWHRRYSHYSEEGQPREYTVEIHGNKDIYRFSDEQLRIFFHEAFFNSQIGDKISRSHAALTVSEALRFDGIYREVLEMYFPQA